MIKEQYVSFETAKLAKEKGFDERCNYVYDKNKTLQMIRNQSYEEFDKRDKYSILCPTQSLLARWLREKHNISVEVFLTKNGYRYEMYDTTNCTELVPNRLHTRDTYEEAMEAGLQEALKLIKK